MYDWFRFHWGEQAEIVFQPSVRVRKCPISNVNLFEALLCLQVAGVAVRMIFHGELAIIAAQFVGVGVG